MPKISFQRRYKNVKRLRQIGNVFIKHGLGYVVGRLNLFPVLSWGKRIMIWRQDEDDYSPKSVAFRIRKILEELGPSFIKLGQMISARPDLVPEEISAEFRSLQDNVPPFPFEQVREVIETEFEAPLESLYSEFDPVPHAAASIAQVHMAKLLNGQQVVVKVQRPGISQVVARDMELLFYFAKLLEKQVPEVRMYRPLAVAEEFDRTIRREMDFVLEANNAQRMKEIFVDDPTVHIPEIYWELTGEKVLTMEMATGVRVDDIEGLKAAGRDLKRVAKHGCDAFLVQIFEHGFFHADPHPGNILIGEDDCVILMDFGIMGHLDEKHVTHIANVMFALTDRDYDRLVHEYLMLGFASPETNIEAFKRDVINFFEPYYGQTLKNIPIGTVFTQAMKLMGKHHIQAPADLTLLAKTFVFVESIARQVDLDFNLLEATRPYAASLLKKRMQPKRIVSLVSKNLSEFGDLFKVMPRQVQLLLRKLVMGELEISIFPSVLESLVDEKRRSSIRLSLSIVIAALLIASAMLIQAPHEVLFLNYSIAKIGLLLAGVFCLILILSFAKQD